MIWFWFLRNFNWQIRDLSADLESLVAVSAFKIFFLVAKRTNANQPEIVERTTTHCKWAPLCAVVLAAVRCWVLFTFLVIYFYLIPKFGLFSSIFIDFRRFSSITRPSSNRRSNFSVCVKWTSIWLFGCSLWCSLGCLFGCSFGWWFGYLFGCFGFDCPVLK